MLPLPGPQHDQEQCQAIKLWMTMWPVSSAYQLRQSDSVFGVGLAGTLRDGHKDCGLVSTGKPWAFLFLLTLAGEINVIDAYLTCPRAYRVPFHFILGLKKKKKKCLVCVARMRIKGPSDILKAMG